MKKFKFVIHGNPYEVDVINVEDNIAEVEVNGTVYKVEIDKKVQTPKTPKLVRSTISPSTESDKSTSKTASPVALKGVGNIKAPLPGTILNVFVREGDTVKVGDKLILLEAMKMENNINSDKEGVITSIKVRSGDSVLEGDILIQIGG